MDTPSVSGDMSSGIFSDAVNIGHYNSNHFMSGSSMGQYPSSRLENSRDFGMLVEDGVLSQDEAKVFKKVQKINIENKSLKNALVLNSDRLQHHVEDCRQWKKKHYDIEESLRDKLKTEKQRSEQLESRLEFFSKAMSTSVPSSSSSASTASSANTSIDLLVIDLKKKTKVLEEKLNASDEEGDNSEDGVICQAYEETIGGVNEFCNGRVVDKFDKKLCHLQSVTVSLNSYNGRILSDAVEDMKNSLTDYQTAISSIEAGNQIPLAQHVQLKHQLESVIADNNQIKEDLVKSLEQCSEKDDENTQLQKEKDELAVCNSKFSSIIQNLHLKVDELENSRSVEVLDMTPQQQPKEIKQLEANIESYKKTIHTLKEQNEILNNDLAETTQSFTKVEDENGEMSELIEEQQESIERLKREIDRLNDMQSNNEPPPDYMEDITSLQMSSEQMKHKLHKLTSEIHDKDTIIRSVTEELERLREKQLVTYELPETTANEDLQHQLELKEKSINDVEEKMKVKEEENNRLIRDLVEKLKIKDGEIKSADEKLKDKDGECFDLRKKITAIESHMSIQKIEVDSKTRIQRNREAKDADKINKLIKCNDNMKKDIENMKKEKDEMRRHIEELQTLIDTKNLLKENDSLATKSMSFIKEDDAEMLDHEVNVTCSESNESFDEYTSTLISENNQLHEEVKSLQLHVQQLKEDNGKMQTNLHSLDDQMSTLQQQNGNLVWEKDNLRKHNSTLSMKFKSLNESFEAESVTANAEITHRCTDLEERLQEETELNSQLHQVKQELEKIISSNRQEMMSMREQVENSQKREMEFSDVHERLQSFELTCDKLKRDNKQTYGNLHAKAAYAKELEEKIDHLTGQLVGAKELIGELQEKSHDGKGVIGELKEKERITELEMLKLREQLDEVTVLRMQLDVYKNDFEAERRSREEQQTTLLQERERVEALTVENHRFKEEIQRIQQRHGSQQYYSRNPVETQQGGYQSTQHNRWQQQQQQSQQQPPQNSSGNWQVYGRGGEQMNPVRTARQQPSRLDNDEQRKCPKCQEVLPDLDSLQIHVMECLDKN